MTLSYRLVASRDTDGCITRFEVSDVDGRSVTLHGWRAEAVVDSVQATLTRASRRLSLALDRPLHLDEHLGVQVLLILRAVKPLSGYQRVKKVAMGIARMSEEEATYWHAHAAHKGGLPALRKLLTP